MRSALAQPDDATALAEIVRDPVRFCRGLLRQDLWPLQEDILRAVASRSRVAVKACHASGKTFVAALVVLWFVTRHRDGIVVTTAPTWTQVEKLLWGEIHRAVQSSRIAFPQLNKTELRIGPGNYAVGLSTDQGVRFQGFHGRVLIVIDEAPGVKADIWEAIEGIRAGGDVRVLGLGNPTLASGPFHDAFTTNRDGWCTFTISAFDSPNLTGLTLDQLLALPDPALASRRPHRTHSSSAPRFHFLAVTKTPDEQRGQQLVRSVDGASPVRPSSEWLQFPLRTRHRTPTKHQHVQLTGRRRHLPAVSGTSWLVRRWLVTGCVSLTRRRVSAPCILSVQGSAPLRFSR
jgi:hypothetical protein